MWRGKERYRVRRTLAFWSDKSNGSSQRAEIHKMTPVIFFLVGALGNERRLMNRESNWRRPHVSGTIHTRGSSAGRSRWGRYGRRSLGAVTRWALPKDPSGGGFWETVHHDSWHLGSVDIIESDRELKAILWSWCLWWSFVERSLLCLYICTFGAELMNRGSRISCVLLRLFENVRGHHKVLLHDENNSLTSATKERWDVLIGSGYRRRQPRTSYKNSLFNDSGGWERFGHIRSPREVIVTNDIRLIEFAILKPCWQKVRSTYVCALGKPFSTSPEFRK